MRGLIIALCAVLVLAACTQSPSAPTPSTATPETQELAPITIGWIGPLTGDAAAYGLPLQKMTQLAVNEINDAGGINGREVSVVYEDGDCTAKSATTAANKLINVDGVTIILGGLCSGETLGIAPLAESQKILLFSAASGSPDITTAGDYVFRNFPSDATSGSKIAEAMIDAGHMTVAVLSEQTGYAQAIRGVFTRRYETLGGKIVSDETYASEESDFRTHILKAKESASDAIYVVPQTPAKFAILVQKVHEQNLGRPFYSNGFVAAKDILDNYGEYIEGAIFAEPKFDAESPMAKQVLENYETLYNEETGGSLPQFYYAAQYDAVYILKEAIESVGMNNEQIKEYLYTIADREGAAGSLTFDANGDPMTEYVLKTVQAGVVVPFQE